MTYSHCTEPGSGNETATIGQSGALVPLTSVNILRNLLEPIPFLVSVSFPAPTPCSVNKLLDLVVWGRSAHMVETISDSNMT